MYDEFGTFLSPCYTLERSNIHSLALQAIMEELKQVAHISAVFIVEVTSLIVSEFICWFSREC